MYYNSTPFQFLYKFFSPNKYMFHRENCSNVAHGDRRNIFFQGFLKKKKKKKNTWKCSTFVIWYRYHITVGLPIYQWGVKSYFSKSDRLLYTISLLCWMLEMTASLKRFSHKICLQIVSINTSFGHCKHCSYIKDMIEKNNWGVFFVFVVCLFFCGFCFLVFFFLFSFFFLIIFGYFSSSFEKKSKLTLFDEIKVSKTYVIILSWTNSFSR